MTSPGQRANQTRDNLTCVGHYWTESPTHNTCTKKSPGSRCVVTGGIKAGPSALFTSRELFGVCEASASRNLLLKGDTLVTEGVVDEGRGNPNKNKSGLSYARYRNTILRMNAGLVA